MGDTRNADPTQTSDPGLRGRPGGCRACVRAGKPGGPDRPFGSGGADAAPGPGSRTPTRAASRRQAASQCPAAGGEQTGSRRRDPRLANAVTSQSRRNAGEPGIAGNTRKSGRPGPGQCGRVPGARHDPDAVSATPNRTVVFVRQSDERGAPSVPLLSSGQDRVGPAAHDDCHIGVYFRDGLARSLEHVETVVRILNHT